MTDPIRVHPIDKTDKEVRARHAAIETRLEEIGLQGVQIKMLHGGLPTEWYPIVTTWMAGDKLAPESGGTETA